MTDTQRIEGIAAVIDIANLDTDQIMPKQFLRGIDKTGLDKGVLWDLRFDAEGRPRADFVLNRPEYAETRVLLAGSKLPYEAFTITPAPTVSVWVSATIMLDPDPELPREHWDEQPS